MFRGFFLRGADRHHKTKSLTRILDENALEYLASRKDFVMDRIGDARNLNENLENNL